jgi:hypothetical protein
MAAAPAVWPELLPLASSGDHATSTVGQHSELPLPREASLLFLHLILLKIASFLRIWHEPEIWYLVSCHKAKNLDLINWVLLN